MVQGQWQCCLVTSSHPVAVLSGDVIAPYLPTNLLEDAAALLRPLSKAGGGAPHQRPLGAVACRPPASADVIRALLVTSSHS